MESMEERAYYHDHPYDKDPYYKKDIPGVDKEWELFDCEYVLDIVISDRGLKDQILYGRSNDY